MSYQCTIIKIRENKRLHNKFSLNVAHLESRFRTLSWEAAFLQRSPIYFLLKSVLKLHVQFGLIASLTARVHGKVRCLSGSSWLVQNNRNNYESN